MDRLTLLQLGAEIEALRSAWAERHPRREQGARLALAGFTYQFLVVLLRTVERWLATPQHARADRQIFNELLADAAELSGDGLICVTQIKLRQSSALLRRALEELWTIYEVAQEKRPHLLDRLSFRVLAAESDLADVDAVVSRWCEEKAKTTGLPVEPFRLQLTVGRETHPEDRLFALLANDSALRAASPQIYIDRWLGQLMAAAGAAAESQALAQAEHRILDDLVTLDNQRHKEHSAVYIWTEEDRPPRTVLPGRFLAGRQPRVGDLRDGCFAGLPALYDDLHSSARALIEQLAEGATDRYKLPILWLQGRSGSGKSVALLHLLARLHEDGRSPIFWLGQGLSLLPDAMRLAIEASRQGKAPLIGLDDPYTPSLQDSARQHWEEAFAQLRAYQDAAEEFSGPVLVLCCGPTEQASQFIVDFADEVEMQRVQVPHEQTREIAELRRWYKERTGQEPPLVEDERVLLVQLFFEWRHGEPLREFALRFKKRVDGVDRSNALFDRLSRVFALNRLYVGYPPEAVSAGLSTAHQGLLRQLESDEHFGVDASGERSGLWWLHPHLANGIYEAWYPPEPRNEPARRDHLRAAIEDSLTYGKKPSERTAPLWAIARALRVDAELDLSQRLQATEIRKLLTGCYLRIVATHGDRLPLQLVPVWIDLYFLVPELTFGLDPIQEGIRQVGTEHLSESGLRLTCHKLLQHLAEMPKGQAGKTLDAILGLLQEAPGWHEWLPITWDAVQRVRDTRLWTLVANWLAVHPKHPSAPRLLETCLRLAPNNSNLVASAERLLPAAQADLAWGDVALKLLEAAPDSSSPASVLTWAQKNRLERGVCFLLGALLRRGVVPAIQWAREWLPFWHREASANFVLEPLLAIEGRSDQIIDWSLAWLDVGRGDPGFLMQRLLDVSSGDERLLARIKTWLEETDPNHRSWVFVWQELRKAHTEDSRLVSAGRSWLAKTAPDHGSWGYIWQELWKTLPDDADLVLESRSWLAKVDPNHGSWGYVWRELWKTLPGDADLVLAGRSWLARTIPDHGSWGYVWQELWKTLPGDAVLTVTGRAWLTKVNPDHGSWKFVWEELWKTLPGDEGLASAGRAWLAKTVLDHGGWGYVWLELWKTLPGDADLISAGRSWLAKTVPDHGSWGYVWLELWKTLPGDADLLVEGRAWLTKVSPDHGSWKFVWEELWKALPGDEGLALAGRAWLAQVNPNHGSWQYVWQELWEMLPADADLVLAGRAWLVQVAPNHGSWQFMWRELRKADAEDSDLLSAGQSWLKAADPNHRSWLYVWEELRKADPTNADLLSEGRSWIAKADPNHRSWQFMWRELRKADPEDLDPLLLGRSWLAKADPRHGGWGYVWPALRRVYPEDADLLMAGRSWFAKADPTHGGWSYVWRELRKADPEDADLLSAGRSWLRGQYPQGPWFRVYVEIVPLLYRGSDLVLKGRAWLERREWSHRSWPYMWRGLWSFFVGEQEFLEMGKDWLAQADLAERLWADLWQVLWTEWPGNPILVESGKRWLEQASPDQPGRDLIEAGVLSEPAGGEETSNAGVRKLTA